MVTPYYEDPWLTVYQGDCRAVLADLPDESVHCVVTSPPYWGLRDYGTATWDGGDPACAHRIPATGSSQNKGNNNREGAPFRERCERCGAVRVDDQLGLEPMPELYVEHMVAVFREVRRVLRKDGTLWLNLGDSYASGTLGRNDDETMPRPKGGHLVGSSSPGRQGTRPRPLGMKPKDLVGIPWRVAFALQADGWYLRSDVIWAKPNPMPESVTDRPTKSHEYLFLLSKSPRYYYDAEAVAEEGRYAGPNGPQHSPYGQGFTRRSEQRTVQVPVAAWMEAGLEVEITAPTVPPTWEERKAAGATAGNVGVSETYQNGVHGDGLSHELGDGGLRRNLRSVWTIATQPYPGAHFATFPRRLVEPCIKAGTSERGVCPECGAPWERVIERVGGPPNGDHRKREGFGGDMKQAHATGTVDGSALSNVYREYGYAENRTTGWRPSCAHYLPPHLADGMHASDCICQPGVPIVPAVILDPFAGSGTTGMVAQSLSRRAILIDLNGDYLVQAMGRNSQTPLGLVGA